MREFLAIVGDTWRQSRQQVVFIVMCVLLALVTIIMVGYPKVHTSESGEKQFGLQFQSEPMGWAAEGWEEVAINSRMVKRDDRVNMLSPGDGERLSQIRVEVKEELEVEAAGIDKMQRSVEFWSYIAATIVFSLSMLLFIGASASYFPDMLATGAVDVVLAKPLSRWQVFLGKYIGGLVLFTAVVTVTYVVIAGGLGLRTGVTPIGMLHAIPMQVFSAAVLYAIVALFGVVFRSTALAVIMGYVFYLVIDSLVGTAASLQMMGISADYPVLDQFLSLSHYLPNFGFLKEVSINSCINVQPFEAKPVIVAAVWMVVTLGLAYFKFRRADY